MMGVPVPHKHGRPRVGYEMKNNIYFLIPIMSEEGKNAEVATCRAAASRENLREQ